MFILVYSDFIHNFDLTVDELQDWGWDGNSLHMEPLQYDGEPKIVGGNVK